MSMVFMRKRFVIKTMGFVYVSQHMVILIPPAAVRSVTIATKNIMVSQIANVGISHIAKVDISTMH